MTHTHVVTTHGNLVTKRYVSCARNEHLREWSALQTLNRHAPDLAPTPVSLDTSGPVLVMTRVAGRPLAGALTPAELDGLATALSRLWALPTAGLQPSLELLTRVRADIASYCADGVMGEAAKAAATWLSGPEVDSLLLPGTAVIGHGDPNLANYLWDGSCVRIVDFEDSGVSDLSFELANLVEHLAGRGTDWVGFAGRFPVDERRLLTARRLWAIFWLTLLRPGGPAEARNPPGTGELQAERVLGLLRQGSGGIRGEGGRPGC